MVDKKIIKKSKKLEKTAASDVSNKERYVEAIGRRKTAVARVRLYPEDLKSKEIIIDGRKVNDYFPLKRHQELVLAAFKAVGVQYKTTVKVKGSGLNAQAEAIRLGIARALVLINKDFRNLLKQLGYLKRDPRMVERKHPGLRKARRAQQWRKR